MREANFFPLNHFFLFKITFALIGKFGASASFAIVFVYTAEMFPTEIRSTAVGASSLCGRIGRVTILMKTNFFMKVGSLQVEI